MAGRRGPVRKSLRKLFPVVTATVTTIPFAVWSPTAGAFFPPVWGLSPPVTAVPVVTVPVAGPPSVAPPLLVAPPVAPPPFVPPPPPPAIVAPPASPPPLIIVGSPPPPCGVPEPATLVSGLLGLAAAAGYGLKRRADKKSAEGERR